MISELEERVQLHDQSQRNLQQVRRGTRVYYRKKPYTDRYPAPGQLKTHIALARAAYGAFDEKDPREAVREEMEGKTYSEPEREPIVVTAADLQYYRKKALADGTGRVLVNAPVILDGRLYEKGVVLVFG